MYESPILGLNQNFLFSDIKYRLNIAKTNSKNLSKQTHVLPVFNITEQTALIQSVYVKQISWGSLYLSATLEALFALQGVSELNFDIL